MALAAGGGDAEGCRMFQAELYRQLISQGVDPKEAQEMATEKSRGAMGKVNEDIMDRALKGETRGSEIFGLDEMQRSAGGGDHRGGFRCHDCEEHR